MNYIEFFIRADKEVVTTGIDFQTKITQIFEMGDYQIWHLRGVTTYAGRLSRREYQPAVYKIVKIRPEIERTVDSPRGFGWRADGPTVIKVADEVKDFESGNNWRKVKAEAIAEAERLAKEAN